MTEACGEGGGEMSATPKEIMATAMRCLMAPEHEHVGNVAAALLAERKAAEAERDRLREALTKTEAEINATSVRFHEVNVMCVAQMMAENDQLRAKYEELDRASERELAATEKEREACEAERDRLREALAKIVNYPGNDTRDATRAEIDMVGIATAALAKEAGQS
jgi:hypothetical protein